MVPSFDKGRGEKEPDNTTLRDASLCAGVNLDAYLLVLSHILNEPDGVLAILKQSCERGRCADGEPVGQSKHARPD
jgi:hypothetical protein